MAAVTLAVLMAAHALLETARDALFLAKIPAEQLPFVYIGVAAAAIVVSTVQDRLRGGGRAQLTIWLVLSAAVTFAFVPLLESELWVLYALYIWSAVVVTVALARLFLLLGKRFTVSQAKRLYPLIGVGSVVGAIAGSALAGALASVWPAELLLSAGASLLLLAAFGPLCLNASNAVAEPQSTKRSLVWSVGEVAAHPYARRVALLLVTATFTFTVVDYLFKSQVAESIDPADLGYFFARVYLALNVISLVVQLFVVNRLLRSGGPTRALAVLPVLLALGGAGIVLGLGIGAAILLKGADGGLRYSLHRTASELLYVPMTDRMRTAAKTFIDIGGHRGSQAVASVAILGATAFGADAVYLGGAVVLLGMFWVGLTIDLRKHYLDLFRTTLAAAAERTRDNLPELDLETLESLIAALNSPDDQRVRVALRMLRERDKAYLIPGLILYHPSPEVLVEALEVLVTTGRDDFLPLADRLLDHEFADVRAAALRAHLAIDPNEELLRRKMEVSCPVVRATALVGLTAGGYAQPDETKPYLDDVVANGSAVARQALARAIAFGPTEQHDDYLVQLAQTSDRPVLLSVAEAMASRPRKEFLPALMPMLARRTSRKAAGLALRAIGAPAFDYLDEKLRDANLDPKVRRNLPRLLVEIDPARAAGVLSAHLVTIQSGAIRYKVLRALNRLVATDPDAGIDRSKLEEALEEHVARAYSYIDWALSLERGATKEPARATKAHGFLVRMIRDKETNTIERIFRLLGLLFPRQDVSTIYRGLRSERTDVRASSRELIESFLAEPLRTAVLGLVDDLPSEQRLSYAGRFHERADDGYEALLRLLLVRTEPLSSLAVYHIGELGLQELRPAVMALDPAPESALAQMIKQVTDRFNLGAQELVGG